MVNIFYNCSSKTVSLWESFNSFPTIVLQKIPTDVIYEINVLNTTDSGVAVHYSRCPGQGSTWRSLKKHLRKTRPRHQNAINSTYPALLTYSKLRPSLPAQVCGMSPRVGSHSWKDDEAIAAHCTLSLSEEEEEKFKLTRCEIKDLLRQSECLRKLMLDAGWKGGCNGKGCNVVGVVMEKGAMLWRGALSWIVTERVRLWHLMSGETKQRGSAVFTSYSSGEWGTRNRHLELEWPGRTSFRKNSFLTGDT